MRKLSVLGACILTITGCSFFQQSQKSSDPAPSLREPAQATTKSGYRVSESDRCGVYPRVAVGTDGPYCLGIVAGEDDGLVFPRAIVQIPDSDDFIISDMGGWVKGKGRILRMTPQGQIQTLFAGLDLPHGLRVGPDKKIYFGTITKIQRFEPESLKLETIISTLPGLEIPTPGGVIRNVHPLTEFVFGRDGSIYVNVGAPTDNCLTQSKGRPETQGCALGDGPRANGAIWKFQAPRGGIFPSLKLGASPPSHTVYAKGLRNSMAMAIHSSGSFLQGENARDLKDPFSPFEEINVVKEGQHYGWPYCYDSNTESEEYKSYLNKNAKAFCSPRNSRYEAPYSLLPPHAAPLGMLYYEGDRLPGLSGKLIITWHGHRPTGNRIASYTVDDQGLPARKTDRLSYEIDCDEPSSRHSPKGRPQAQPDLIVNEWFAVPGLRPEGAPVGMTVARDGSLWIVEDKNKSILRLDHDPLAHTRSFPDCQGLSATSFGEKRQILMGRLQSHEQSWEDFQKLKDQYLSTHCTDCHSGFGVKAEMSPKESYLAMAEFLFSEGGWIVPGHPEQSKIHQRVRGLGETKIMPDNGYELLKDPEYRAQLDSLDEWIKGLGQWYRVQLNSSTHLNVRNAQKQVCGQIPKGQELLVVGRGQGEMLGFYQIFENRQAYLNGTCTPDDKLYVGDCCVEKGH